MTATRFRPTVIDGKPFDLSAPWTTADEDRARFLRESCRGRAMTTAEVAELRKLRQREIAESIRRRNRA